MENTINLFMQIWEILAHLKRNQLISLNISEDSLLITESYHVYLTKLYYLIQLDKVYKTNSNFVVGRGIMISPELQENPFNDYYKTYSWIFGILMYQFIYDRDVLCYDLFVNNNSCIFNPIIQKCLEVNYDERVDLDDISSLFHQLFVK